MDSAYGKILYRFDDKDECILARVLRIYKPDDVIHKAKLYAYKIPDYNIEYCIDPSSGVDLEGNKWTPLSSDGILFIGHASITAANQKLNDIICVYFDADSNEPKVIARQSLLDIYAAMLNSNSSKVGFSVTKESCPSGYSMNSFMIASDIDHGFFMSIYKTDTSELIKKLYEFSSRWSFNNVGWIKSLKDIDKIFSDLRLSRLEYNKRNVKGFKYRYYEHNKLPVDGFCSNLKIFADSVGLFDDIHNVMGICTVDFPLENDKVLNKEEIQMISLLYGGVRINKTVVLKYSFDIDLDAIKMKYFLIMDSKDELYIVGYTSDESEVPVAELEEIEKNEVAIRERLKQAVRAFDGYDINILEESEQKIAKNDSSNNILPEQDLSLKF